MVARNTLFADDFTALCERMRLSEPGLIGKPAVGFLPRSLALWAAAAYVGLFIIRPWELLIPQLADFRFERCFAIFMVLVVVATVGFRVAWNRQNLAVAAFCLAISITTIYAYDVQLAWTTSYVFFTQIVCYWVLISVIRSPYELLFIVGAYIGFMEIYLAKALWEFFLHGAGRQAMGVSRLTGIELTFGHPNTFANSVVVSLPIWLALWRWRREILAKWPPVWRRMVVRALAIYPALGVLSVALTNSRTGMVNLCCFVVLARLQLGGRLVRSLFIAFLIVAVGWLALPQEQKQRVTTIWDSELNESAEASKQGRIQAIRLAITIFQDFPLTGIGPGNFGNYRSLNLDGDDHEPHNLVGQMLAEMGVLGTAAFALLVGVMVGNCRRTRFVAQYSDIPTLQVLSGLATAFIYSTILLLIAGLAGHNLYRFNWLWLAAFSSLALQFAWQIRLDSDSLRAAEYA